MKKRKKVLKKTTKKRIKLHDVLFSPHLEEGEKIIYVVHRHPVVVLKPILEISLVGVFLPVFFWFIIPEVFFVWGAWVIISVWKLAYELFVWFHDAILVTSASLIDVRWNGPFDRTSTRLDYTQIEGTTFEIKGLWRTILNYGNLKVEGAGVSINLVDAMDPAQAEKIIMAEQGKAATDKSLKDAQVLKELLANMIATQNKNHGLGEVLK